MWASRRITADAANCSPKNRGEIFYDKEAQILVVG
jgi:hypothetical protein